MLEMGGGIIFIITFQILLFSYEKKKKMLLSHSCQTHGIMYVKTSVIEGYPSIAYHVSLICASMAWFLVHTTLLCGRVHVGLTMFPGSNSSHLATCMS